MLPPGFLPDQIRDKGLARVRDASWRHIVVTGHNKVRVCLFECRALCLCAWLCAAVCFCGNGCAWRCGSRLLCATVWLTAVF